MNHTQGHGAITHLRCPVCTAHLTNEPTRLVCPSNHSFDRAKQGYFNLRAGTPATVNADTAAMVSAREEHLAQGFYEPIRTRAAQLVTTHAPGAHLIVDLAGGTGYYLAGLLDAHLAAHGICFDLSTYALRRAAKSHPRALALGVDLRHPLPLATDSVAVATSFFGPRNIPEIQRVLEPGGHLLVVTPTPRHLNELVSTLGMVSVHEEKAQRLAATLSDFTPVAQAPLEYDITVTHADIKHLVLMGPSAHHITPAALDTKLVEHPAHSTVTVSVNVGMYRHNKVDSPRVKHPVV